MESEQAPLTLTGVDLTDPETRRYFLNCMRNSEQAPDAPVSADTKVQLTSDYDAKSLRKVNEWYSNPPDDSAPASTFHNLATELDTLAKVSSMKRENRQANHDKLHRLRDPAWQGKPGVKEEILKLIASLEEEVKPCSRFEASEPTGSTMWA